MLNLLLLVIAAGILPLALAAVKLKPGGGGSTSLTPLGSILLATLAFNLTFFWQELWLAIPKAMTPDLYPVLYHNNHEWTGDSPIAELLQGTGAIATMASGIAFTLILKNIRTASPTWQVFFFWMAFEGLFQSLSQLAIGALVPGNDIGRALAFLGFSFLANSALLIATVAAFALAGIRLAELIPQAVISQSTFGTRRSMLALCATGAATAVLSVPFRVPRNLIEVLMIPAIVNLIGVAWLLLGSTLTTRGVTEKTIGPLTVVLPSALLLVLLLFFQVILRPGIRI